MIAVWWLLDVDNKQRDSKWLSRCEKVADCESESENDHNNDNEKKNDMGNDSSWQHPRKYFISGIYLS